MKVYQLFGHAVAGQRDRVYTQIHFGAVYEDENYGRIRNPELVKRSFDKMLNAVNPDLSIFITLWIARVCYSASPGGGCVQDIKDVTEFYEADESGKDYSR